MKIISPSTSLLIVLSAGSMVAAQPDLTKLPPPAQKAGLTYAKDIHPILEKSCFGCHGERRQRGELRLDSLEAALKGGEDGQVILPGKSQQSPLVIAVAQLDEDTAMPPKRRPGGGRGGFGGGGGGMGRTQVSRQMIAQADKSGDGKASSAEWAALAEAWTTQLDPDRTGKITQEQFNERLPAVLANNAEGNGRSPTGVAGYVTTGFFTAADLNKDGTIGPAELKATFKKWFDQWGKESEGGLSQAALYAGWREIMPQTAGGGAARTNRRAQTPRGGSRDQAAAPDRPGAGNRSGRPGGGDGGGNGNGGGGNPPAPLTKEEVSLVRAWIDQGAK